MLDISSQLMSAKPVPSKTVESLTTMEKSTARTRGGSQTPVPSDKTQHIEGICTIHYSLPGLAIHKCTEVSTYVRRNSAPISEELQVPVFVNGSST